MVSDAYIIQEEFFDSNMYTRYVRGCAACRQGTDRA